MASAEDTAVSEAYAALRSAVANLRGLPPDSPSVTVEAHQGDVVAAAERLVDQCAPRDAYVPVRCDACAFWKAGKRQFWKTTDQSKPPAFGECTAARPPKVLLRADGEAHVRMITLDSFGCVQFEAKP